MIISSWLLVVLILLALIVVTYIYQLKQLKKFGSINGPLVLPVVGSYFLLWYLGNKYQNINSMMFELFRRYGNIIQIHVGPFHRVVATTDPKIAQKIINSTKESTKSSTYDILKPWMGEGLLTGSGSEKWRKRKKIVAHMFGTPSYLEHYITNFNNFSQILVHELKDFANEQPVDIYPILTLCTLHIIHESVYGCETNAEIKLNPEYIRSMKGISVSVLKRIMSVIERPDFIFNNFTENGKRYYACLEIIRKTTTKIIQQRKKIITEKLQHNNNNLLVIKNEDGINPRMTYLDKLLQEQMNVNYLSDTDIFEDISAIIFAGHDTSSYGISFALYALANHPDIQDKVLQEIKDILGDDKTRMPTISDLNNMTYLELVIKETLRMYSPAPFIGRRLQDKIDLGEFTLPPNTECIIFLNGMHRTEKYFPNPEQFIPERFLDPDIEKVAYMPFSGGQRKCSGYKYAMYEMKVLIADIIRNYEIIPLSSDYKPEIILGVVSRPRRGIYIKIRPRI